jgi:hypothetical protein
MTMSGHDEVAAAASPAAQAAEQGSGFSRRTALRTAATAGLAAGAVAAMGAPALAASRPAKPLADDPATRQAHDGQPVVAHLRDARTGEIDLFHGTNQVRLHDPALAAALLRAGR